mmetsp:Transcript_5280/g.7765  ORF Transcript_5280/g.7765 Transcript_5280/m.7765 type:complete len:86 (+) Transcript_5280:1113-1370(+)
MQRHTMTKATPTAHEIVSAPSNSKSHGKLFKVTFNKWKLESEVRLKRRLKMAFFSSESGVPRQKVGNDMDDHNKTRKLQRLSCNI